MKIQPTFKPSAFTLIEVVCVVAVIGILVGILVPKVIAMDQSSRQARNDANAKIMMEAISKASVLGNPVTDFSSPSKIYAELVSRNLVMGMQPITDTEMTVYTNSGGGVQLVGTYDN